MSGLTVSKRLIMGVKVNSKLFKSKLKQFVAFKTKSDPSSHVKVPMAFYMHFLFYLIPKAMICLMFDKLRNGILSIERICDVWKRGEFLSEIIKFEDKRELAKVIWRI